MNVAPALSPDGKCVAFFARRGLFTVDLYVADADTGKVVKTLTGPNADPHFDALSFVSASGSWSPDGRKLAFISFQQGDNGITIFDVELEEGGAQHCDQGRRRDQRRGVESRTARRSRSSGMAGGISDLYLVDVTSGQVRQLTNDRYAELQPAWSPDGARSRSRRIAGPTPTSKR